MIELYMEGINFLIGLACVFGVTLFILLLLVVINYMFSG